MIISYQVDILGLCGSKDCKTSKKDYCNKLATKQYKFYLSFENSLCDQYVTEKLFLRMKWKMVPIVMGRAPYHEIVPPNSYINIKDFKDPKSLAKYLLKLDKNPEEYLSYFWWREHFQIRSDVMHKMACQICYKLNTQYPQKIYHDLEEWWVNKSHCVRTPLIKWKKIQKSWFG